MKNRQQMRQQNDFESQAMALIPDKPLTLELADAAGVTQEQYLDIRERLAQGYGQLEVNHSGGCGDHDFALFMSPATFAESVPVQANLWLQHRDRDDPCDGMVLQTLTFDLQPVAGLHRSWCCNSPVFPISWRRASCNII